eukprot:4449656-Pyramimonas_sp.AAC.1
MCATNGSTVTADHLAAVRHKNRTEGAWNNLASFTRGWGRVHIVQVHTDENYIQPPPQQLALPAPQLAQAAPGLQPPPAAAGRGQPVPPAGHQPPAAGAPDGPPPPAAGAP